MSEGRPTLRLDEARAAAVAPGSAATRPVPSQGPTGWRRFELDWLRVLTIVVMLFFHSARFFDDDGWHVKNPETSPAASFFTALTVQWMMPLFFFISGASLWFSLERRSTGACLKERTLRLLIPFLFGTLTLIPPQVYLERLTHGQFSGSFFRFFPRYFEGWYGFGGNFAWMGLHLWYLEALFVFSLAALPLFLLVRRGGAAMTARLLNRWWAVYVVALPVAALELVLDPRGLGTRVFGGWNLCAYLVVFVGGFVLYSSGQTRERIRRQRGVSLALGAVCLAALLHWRLGGGAGGFEWLERIVRGLNSWFWLLTIVGFALENLYWPPRWLARANEWVMPFYMLHQTVILIIGYFVIALPLAIPVKFGLIAGLSLGVILALCALIARANVLRFPFGMPARRGGSAVDNARLLVGTRPLISS